MNILFEFIHLVKALNAAGIPHAVCGGLAMAVHGYPRATKDIDLLVHPDDLSRVEEVVKIAGFDVPGGLLTFKKGTAEETRVLRVNKIQGGRLLTLDLLLVTPVFAEVWAGRQKAVLSDLEFTVVSKSGLSLMKSLAGRAQDKADLEKLGEIAEDGP